MIQHARRHLALCVALGLALAAPGLAQPSFVAFESGPVRPLALSPDGTKLFAANTPDNTLEIFTVDASGLTHEGSVPVGMEPVAVAARNDGEVWVVNHLSDSVSIVDVAGRRVTRTLLVGDEPRDIVITDPDGPGTLGDRAFIATAHRGQQRTHPDVAGRPGGGDPQLTTPGVGRLDVWVFDAGDLDQGAASPTLGGVPEEIVVLFGDGPRALAVEPAVGATPATVYAAVFFSGNRTSVVNEGLVCDGFGSTPCAGDGITSPNGLAGGNLPGGNPGPAQNTASDPLYPGGATAPEVGLIVQLDPGSGEWRDEGGRNWSNGIRFHLPDEDVFAINAATLATSGGSFAGVGTTLFNMVVNPVNGNLYVSNTDSQNLTRFEGPGVVGGSTVQGNLARSHLTVITPTAGTVEPRHVNRHIDYGVRPAPAGTEGHSLATPLDMVVSSDGATLYVAAFGSGKVGVFDTADLENDVLWTTPYPGGFDPAVESAGYLSVSGGGPAGLALDETHDRLYVATRFDNSVSVIDLGTGAEVNHIPLHNPEPEAVTAGRHMLYDAVKTSSNGEASCSSCHVFGDLDQLAWDLGNPDDVVTQNTIPFLVDQGNMNGGAANDEFHPMKGPMTTQTLRGLANSGGMHWRGDRVDGFFGLDDPYVNTLLVDTGDENLNFNNFIVAFEGLVGDDVPATDAQRQADMQLFTDFALQLTLPPNPIRPLDNSLSASAAAGADFFDGPRLSDVVFTCEGCHTTSSTNGFFGTGGLATFENETQMFKVPHLRNMYQKVGMFGMPGNPFTLPGDHTHQGDQIRGFGFLHDGSTDTLFRFFQAVVFQNVGFSGFQSDTERRDMEQFMFEFDSDLAPIVGQQVTVTGATPMGPTDPVPVRIGLMETRAGTAFDSKVVNAQPGNVPVTECDLVAAGAVAGEMRRYLYDPVADDYEPDRSTEGTLTRASLVALATTPGQEITFTCVPPGSGSRVALDRDGDGVVNRDELNDGTDPANPAHFVNACNDGIDNDGDGATDVADPGCRSIVWHIENPECNDGYDNDNDGLADAADPNCVGRPHKKDEAFFSLCGMLGIEPFLALGLARLLRIRRARHPKG